MPRIDVPDGMRPLSYVDELAPGLRGAMKELRRLTLDETSLSLREIEVIRLRCAKLNGCATCLGYRIARDDPARAARADGLLTAEFYDACVGDGDEAVLSARERLLWELSERFSLDHFSLDDDEPLWARMSAAFGDAALVEAAITVMSFAMSARFNHMLGVDGEACEVGPAELRELQTHSA